MTHLLHIDASPRGDRSVSRSLARAFVTEWQSRNPNGTVTYRDLGHNPVPLVSETWISAAFNAPQNRTPEEAEEIAVSETLIDEFLSADCYVFGVPMYNFSIPAGLKAYLDQIIRVNRTFSVDDSGYHGLAQGERALFTISQGGRYRPGTAAHAYDMQMPYLKLAFGFIGVTDVTFIKADKLAEGEQSREQSLSEAQKVLSGVAEQWSASVGVLV